MALIQAGWAFVESGVVLQTLPVVFGPTLLPNRFLFTADALITLSLSELAEQGVFPMMADDAVTPRTHVETGHTYTVNSSDVTRVTITSARSLADVKTEALSAAVQARDAQAAAILGSSFAIDSALLEIARRIVAGTQSAADTSTMTPLATAASTTVALYSAMLVAAGNARQQQICATVSSYVSSANAIAAAVDVTATFAAQDAIQTSAGVSALSNLALWLPFRLAANSGSSTMTGSGAVKTFTRGTLSGLRGIFIKLADLGIVPDSGSTITVEIDIKDTTSTTEPMPVGSTLVMGLLNSKIAAHGADIVNLIDLAASVPVTLPPLSPAIKLSATAVMSSGRDAVFIGGDTLSNTLNMTVLIESLTVRKA
jgi:hypothetical protein